MNPNTWNYLETITLYRIHFFLPGVFEDNLYKFVVNGSLWTLPLEFSLYIFLFILGFIGIYRKKITIVILFLIFLFLYWFYRPLLENIQIPFIGNGLLVYIPIGFFLAGMLYYLYRDKIILNWPIFVFLFFLWIVLIKSQYLILISLFVIPYFVIFIASIVNKKLNSFGKNMDLSYGIYIIAFPIQQLIIYEFNNTIDPLLLFILSLLLIIPLAAVSWFIIEKPALSLKNTDIALKFKKISIPQLGSFLSNFYFNFLNKRR